MNIEIKKSKKPINYDFAVKKLEERVNNIINKKAKNELIWFLEHPSIYTGGSSFKQNEILDNSINVIKTSRGGKITWHGPGQLICYLVIDLNKRKKDIRKFINLIEKVIIKTLNDYKIESFSDRKNVGIWYKKKNKIFKIAAIGIRVKNWVAYHGFSLNVNNNLNSYKKIIPCGINDREVTNLFKIKNQDYKEIIKKLEKNLLSHLKN